MKNNPTFLGKVVAISGSCLTVTLTPQVKSGLLIIEGKTHRIGQVGSFVRIPQGYNDLYGIISETSETFSNQSLNENNETRTIKLELVGETVGGEFERGVSQYPSINDEAHLVTEKDLKQIYGESSSNQVTIGKLSSSDSINVSLDLDRLINRHSALLGSTGSGKSTSVSSLLRAIVTNSEDEITKPSARIVLIDIHGEYSAALKDISTVLSVSPQVDEGSLYIPYWCVNPERLIDFLCGHSEQVKNKFLHLITEEKVKYANKNSLKIESSKITPYTPLPFRLKKIWHDLYHEDNVNWEEKEKNNPAYEREGDFSTLTPPIFKPPGTGANPPFKGGPQAIAKPLNHMRARLLDSQYSFFLSPGAWEPDENNQVTEDLPKLIHDWIGNTKPITIIDLSGMPSSRLDLLLGSTLDILFESAIWGRNLEEGMKNLPLLIVLEEAHRYLSSESGGLSKEMVRRIAKEGRKFGVGSMLVSQRPSEIDETILSQCGTLFSLRISNATDRARVKSAMPDGLSGIIDSLPILRTGEAIISGEAAKLPMRCRFHTPKKDRYPDSKDPSASMNWAQEHKPYSFTKLVESWRQQDANTRKPKD